MFMQVVMNFLTIINTNLNVIYLSSVPLGISFEANRQSLVVSFTTNFFITQLLNLVELSFTNLPRRHSNVASILKNKWKNESEFEITV